MAAPRNEIERERLYKAAVKLFMKKGFSATTYSDIANACETSKSMVQHYFPKKELFVSQFFEEHLESIAAQAQKEAAEDPLRVFCLMGLQHFDMIQNNKAAQAFISDILTNRELTNGMICAERDWAKDKLKNKSGTIASEDALTISLGGAYELLYQSRKNGVKLSPLYIERAAIIPFALTLGYTRKQIESTLAECAEQLGLS